MLHALCVIALSVLFGGGPVRLCSIFVKFGGFVVIAVRHVRFLKFSSQRQTICQTPSRSQMSRNSVAGILVGSGRVLNIKIEQTTSIIARPFGSYR
jgi:hypothetical protein